MHIWRTTQTDKGLYHDYNTDLPTYDEVDMTDTESSAIGSPRDIINYILKNDLKEYKLVKRKHKLAKGTKQLKKQKSDKYKQP